MESKIKYSVIPAKLQQHVKLMIAINEKLLPENYQMEYWTYAIAQHHSFVTLSKGEVIGYCLGAVPPIIDGIRLKTSSKPPTILSFAVLPEYQNLGIGKELLQKVCQSFREKKYSVVNLTVRTSNNKAHKLYVNNGFTDTKTLPLYYSNEDGILMTKIL